MLYLHQQLSPTIVITISIRHYHHEFATDGNDNDGNDILIIISAHSKVISLQCTCDSTIHTGQAPFSTRHITAANKGDIVGVGGKDGNDNKKT